MMFPTKQSLCAIVTSFNPDSGFADNLSRISKQVDKIVIIDNNSDASTLVLLKEVSKDGKIHIIYNAANFGVATALNQGVRWAKMNNYDWIILCDLNGKLLIHQNEKSVNGVINLYFDTSGIIKGVYLLRVNSNRGDYIIKKLVKI